MMTAPRRSLPALALACSVATGCGLAPGGASPSAPAMSAAGAVGAEAPEACGFPPGTPLEFAGRSTTAELNVQEVVGDPMSDDPADIYITREAFDQGENHGRLVCAIFVNDPHFVEITVHPADDPFVPPTPAPAGSRPAAGLTEQEAVEIAHAHVGGESGEWGVAVAKPGSVARLVHDWEAQEWAADLAPDHWVWRVFLVRDDEGVDVFIDYVDGSVLGELQYIVN